MKKLVRLLVLIPLALLLLWVAVANQHDVQFSLDPIQSLNPAISFQLPLHWIIFGSLGSGVLLGGLWTWIDQGHHRKTARVQKRAANRWHEQAQQAQAKLEEITREQNLEPVSRQAETKRAIALLASDSA